MLPWREVRLGAVTYLNTRPLIFRLSQLAPGLSLRFDVPSQLADALAAGELDVATIPSIEHFRLPRSTIVSDACVACAGAVQSVNCYSRVPWEQMRTLALDVGSRTSAALVRILLWELHGIQPELQPLPLTTPPESAPADAVLVIGDRGMRRLPDGFPYHWDLGEQWWRWTGLPMVFSMWVARPGWHLPQLDELLATARDLGLQHLATIARSAAAELGLPAPACLSYLRDHLRFRLGEEERAGLELFRQLAERHGLLS
jgi:chorismate dehydratase